MIKNLTKDIVLADKHKFCSSLPSKARGLMFSGKKALIMDFKKEQIVSLHMLFVFFSIDVLFLDENKKVVEIKRDFRPFSFYTPKCKARYVIELPIKSKADLGDFIEWHHDG